MLREFKKMVGSAIAATDGDVAASTAAMARVLVEVFTAHRSVRVTFSQGEIVEAAGRLKNTHLCGLRAGDCC